MKQLKDEILNAMYGAIKRLPEHELATVYSGMSILFLSELMSMVKPEYRAEETIRIVAEAKKVCEKFEK